jgi:hypothetical protein
MFVDWKIDKPFFYENIFNVKKQVQDWLQSTFPRMKCIDHFS